MSLEKYSVEKLIGKGSYGEVFLAKHKKDKRMYVVKKVSLQKASERERQAAELEARLLSQLRHPNIVSYRESFQGDQGFLYIVMNYCEGGDLYTKLKAQKSRLLDETQIVQWFVQIAMALQYMHEKHILHRDLKTQNIFLTRSKIIKLGDLGIAKVLENSSDMAHTLIGTPYYMSPELFSNQPYNHKSDVWALGCCLYEMCTLRHAFNAKDMSSLVYKILKGKKPPLPKQYSADLCSIIKNMLDQDPDKRPSVSRLLRHPYIKKQIAKFLEGTKNRQKQKTTSSEKKVEAMPRSFSASDSGYSEGNLQSIATVSHIDCVVEDTEKPAAPNRQNSSPRNDPPKPVQRSPSDENVEITSIDSSHSSSSSSEPLERENEVNAPSENGIIKQKDGKEREKEAIKKQMAERRRKSAFERPASKDKVEQEYSLASKKGEQKSSHGKVEEKPVRRVLSAGSSRPPTNEIKPPPRSRPLPRPPAPPSKPAINEAPMSKSPRARRRYKVSAKPQSQDEEEEEEEEDKSTASVDSEKSSHSVSESCSQHSGLSARERRRLRQSASGSPILTPSASYNTPPLPSPKGIIADIQRKKLPDQGHRAPIQKSHEHAKKSHEDLDCVDGPSRRPYQEMKSLESEDSGSDLEEASTDEPSSEPSARRRSEVSSLISALDSTLKLVDEPADRTSPELDEPYKPDKFLPPSDASPTHSGRLRDRIERLRRECLQGIGEGMLSRAYKIIDEVNEDKVEDELVKCMGRENFERFGGPIWQLKFCESFKIS